MGYLSCNADSSIATCDPYNWELHRKPKTIHKKPFKITHFSYSDLETATNSFSPTNFLGKGSHGSVFKASLHDGHLIAAVKKSTSSTTVDNEIEILSRVRSPRLVNLLGFSSDSVGRKVIVVEYMPNGSLHDILHTNSKPPAWLTRVRFALQVAKAVQLLHLSNPPVIHRDIKSSNVLIDGENNARLGDFGLALRGHVEDVKIKCTPPAGTMGYLDPGYLAPGDLSAKSDVFSFGILLLEIISGRKAIDMKYSPPSVVDWAAPLIRGGEYEAVCDVRIGPPEDAVVMRRLAVVAARCVRSTTEKRPEMAEVVECLNAVCKRVSSPIWNNFGRRVGMGACSSSQSVAKYEPLDESYAEIVKTTTRVGIRRNRKVSSVPGVDLPSREVDALNLNNKDQVGRSRSVGSGREIRSGPLDSNLDGDKQLGGVRRRVGSGVKVPTVRLNKSRSMGMFRSSKLVNDNGFVVQFLKNPNGKEKEEAKLLVINSEKRSPQLGENFGCK